MPFQLVNIFGELYWSFYAEYSLDRQILTQQRGLERQVRNSGYRQPQPLLVRKFVRTCLKQRESEIDVQETAAYTESGLLAHQAAMKS